MPQIKTFMTTLNICEIFYSIQGESSFVGRPCIFVRLGGCNLHCRWCDTRYAAENSQTMALDEILEKISQFGCKLVEITGGEPMLQKGALTLMDALLSRGYEVLLETNGSQPLDDVPEGVHRIIDLKCPGSGCTHDVALWRQYARSWRALDEIKCVVCGRGDFDWAMDKLKSYDALGRVAVYFSPVWGEIQFSALAQWICESHQPVRLNLQIQKIIWDPDARGV